MVNLSKVARRKFAFRSVLFATIALGCATVPAVAQTGEDNSPAAHHPGNADIMSMLRNMMKATSERIAAANATDALRGSGPYPAMMKLDIAYPNATMYRPADLDAMGDEKLGLLIWGNGGCANDGASASNQHAEIASHGYLVMAPGRPMTGPLAAPNGPQSVPMTTTTDDLRAMLDWALAENGREGSPYYGRIDTNAIAAAGHSCGGMQAIMLGDDPRVATVVIQNSGVNPVIPDMTPLTMDWGRLNGLRNSALFIVGGESDVLWSEANGSFDRVKGIPSALVSADVGHGGTFEEPFGGKAAKIALDWLQWNLRGDAQAAKTFEGKNCALCNDPDWTIRKKNIR